MNDELLKALELIREECKKHHNCEDCPLICADGDCGVTVQTPQYWSLKKREVYF